MILRETLNFESSTVSTRFTNASSALIFRFSSALLKMPKVSVNLYTEGIR
jgi:hypothetical protein